MLAVGRQRQHAPGDAEWHIGLELHQLARDGQLRGITAQVFAECVLENAGTSHDSIDVTIGIEQARRRFLSHFGYTGNAVRRIAHQCQQLLKLVRANTVPGQPQMTVGDVLPVLIIGAMVANYADSLNAAWQTFGTGSLSYGAINYEGASGFGPLAPAVNAVLTLAALFGGFFGLKGLVLIRKANNGASSHGAEDYVWKGIGHLFGGAALANIPRMIDAARASLHLVW